MENPKSPKLMIQENLQCGKQIGLCLQSMYDNDRCLW